MNLPVTTTVGLFAGWAFANAGATIDWLGSGVDEQGFCTKTGVLRVAVDPRHFRPTEVDLLIGDPAVLLTMALPTLLLIVARYRPKLLSGDNPVVAAEPTDPNASGAPGM